MIFFVYRILIMNIPAGSYLYRAVKADKPLATKFSNYPIPAIFDCIYSKGPVTFVVYKLTAPLKLSYSNFTANAYEYDDTHETHGDLGDLVLSPDLLMHLQLVSEISLSCAEFRALFHDQLRDYRMM